MTLGIRPRLAALLAAGAVLMAGPLVVVSTLGAPVAHAAPTAGSDEPDDVFSASIERIARDPGAAGRPDRYTYTLQVQEVFGRSDISSVRVPVLTTAAFNTCATRPESRGDTLYLWALARQDDDLVADGCRDVLRATDVRLAAAADTYGEPRSPVDADPEQPQVMFPDVSYLCPETSEAISQVADAEQTCAEISSPQSFDRAAAPGLALIIVGILGWIVVLRLGRPRRS